MFRNKRIVALIPLRGGSKSIPYKNIKEIAGKPLAYWVCDAAKKSKYIDDVYVSTEDAKIKDAVSAFNLGIKICDRSLEAASDIAPTESVVMEFMEKIPDFDIMVLIQATSPLTRSSDFDVAMEHFFAKGHDSLFSGVIIKRFFWTKDAKPLNYDPMKRPRRQDWDGTVIENGAFFITKKEILEKYKNRLGGKIGVYVMPEYMAAEIDEPDDWPAIEKLLLKYSA